jgi:hypothetical protein
MPFTINIQNNLNQSVSLELTDTEILQYSDIFNKLPVFPTSEQLLDIFRDIPASKTLALVNLFESVMVKRLDKPRPKDLAKLFSLLPDYILWYDETYGIFSQEYLNILGTEVLNPKYLKKSNLSAPFKTTKGFDVQFKSEYKDNVIKYFPFFKDYIEEIFSDDVNIFYLNALVLGLDSYVKHHYDQTLMRYSTDFITYPVRVSVLYVDVPEMVGGDFVLYKNERFQKAVKNKVFTVIKPESNKLLCFKGSLSHEILGITEVKSLDKPYRISVVCEQYRVDAQVLKKIPNFYSGVPRSNWFKMNI